jgi:hypothetical protein
LRHIADGQVAGDAGAIVAEGLNPRAVKRHAGESLDIEKISRAQVSVPLRLPGVDARNIDDGLDG